MNKLLVFDSEGEEFDAASVKQGLSAVEGVFDLREGAFIGSVLECEYATAGDRTIVRLSDDLKTISFTGLGDASLTLAMELQRRLGRRLRAIDLGYSFEVDLGDYQTLEALREAVRG